MELIRSVAYPSELWALFRFKFGGGKEMVMPTLDYISTVMRGHLLTSYCVGVISPEMKRCYELLNQTSRSFAAVIQALDDELRPAICIFYLVLRTLDTVEDDMNIPVEKKTAMLKEFHKHLYEEEWRFMESTEKDKAVLEEFPKISKEFRNLKPIFQEVISDITQKMGSGMTVFLTDKVDGMAQWDEYCHYVAGLVGIGLSRLFSASELESSEVGEDHQLANSMGLFLQKTNIIRDYLEDILQGREFWPKEAWSQFADELTDFKLEENRGQAVHCLNLLITNALHHVPDVLKYMSRIRNQSVFNFCAIPQTMAMATLAVCYNNPRVFTGVVKIRKGQAVALMMQSTNMKQLHCIMAQFAREISSKIDPTDPNAEKTQAITEEITKLCREHTGSQDDMTLASRYPLLPIAGLVAISAVLMTYYAYQKGTLS